MGANPITRLYIYKYCNLYLYIFFFKSKISDYYRVLTKLIRQQPLDWKLNSLLVALLYNRDVLPLFLWKLNIRSINF